MTPSENDGTLTQAQRGEAVLALLLMVPILLWNGWIFACMWGWFIAPFGVQAIGTSHAAGLFLLLGMLRRKREGGAKAAVKVAIEGSVANGIIFGLGYLMHCFM